MGTGKRKKPAGCCYHCGSADHRAKSCPDAVCRICGARGHDPGGCPDRPAPPIDLGSFGGDADGNVGITRPADFTYAELFAGIGGFGLALDRLGGRCVLASEIDSFARASFAANHGGTVPAGDVARLHALDHVPDHDVLCGGFPCQPFSSSGRREGFDDGAGRGVLFLEIVRIARARRPRALLMENVRGLLTHDEGRTLGAVVRELEGCGYSVTYSLVDAKTVLPQERQRLFIVGIRRDLPGADKPFEVPVFPSLDRGVRDVLHTPSGSDSIPTDSIEALQLSPHQLGKVRSQSYTKRFPGARFLSDPVLPAKTLQSSYASYMVGSQFVRIDYSENKDGQSRSGNVTAPNDNAWRRFSPREAARLMGFPEYWALCPHRPYHLLGNAVAPPVVAAIAAPLLLRIGVPAPDGHYRSSARDKVASVGHGGTPGYRWGWSVAKQLLIEASPDDSRREKLAALLERHSLAESSTAAHDSNSRSTENEK